MNLLYISLFFITGAVFGSFLNVVIFRIPKKESLSFPPSHCMSCSHPLKILDLIPILSYVFLKGRCRYCHRPISIQYPLMELLTAVLFTTSYLLFGLKMETFILCFISLFLIPIAAIDFKHYIIPNKILLVFFPISIIVGLLHIKYPLFFYYSIGPLDPIFGALIGSSILFLVALLGYVMYRKNEVMGMGDVKLLIVLGMLLGFQNTLLLLGLSVVLGAIGAILLLVTGKKSKKDMIAFAPYIVVSFYIVIWISSKAYM
ncbi:MAG: prepilin peptidase [Bacilli bacterium]